MHTNTPVSEANATPQTDTYTQKKLKILSTNARSINSKLQELKATAVDLKPDIIAITETWTNTDICNSFLNIPGYKIVIRKDRGDTTNGRGGGILIYARSTLICQEVSTPPDIIQTAATQVQLSDSSLNVYVVYRSPNSSTENNNKLNELLRTIPPNSIIVGDFNYPSINWDLLSGNGHAKEFIDAIGDNFLTQHVTFPTHDCGNILDLVISNIPNRIHSILDSGKLGNSDHCIILTDIEATFTPHVPKHEVWDFKYAKFEEMRDELRNTQWEAILIHDIESDWNTFRSIFTNLCNKHIPKKTAKQLKQPPWLKRENLRLVRQKRAAWNRIRANNNQAVDIQNFKTLQKKVKNSVRKAKHSHEVRISKDAKTNPKMFYSYLSKKKKNKVQVGPLSQESGELCSDDQEMAEILNKHYSNVFTTENPTLPPSPPSSSCPQMPDITFTQYGVTEVLKHLKNSTSPGPDGISQRVLKETAHDVSLPLCLLFNKSLRTGTLPMDWKKANVVPIYKSGSKAQPINYRPISLTSVIVRVMERVLKERMLHHLKTNQLINPSQHGFLPKKSTSTNLVAYLDYLTKNLDEGQPVDVLYLDFSKAFDKVPHQRLIQKLKTYNFSKELIAWIAKWLEDRKQRVLINGTYSEWRNVISSVIQGSVLGPILFVIYINDIDTCLDNKEGIMPKFADDTKVAKIVKNTKTAEEMQDIIDRLVTWSKDWGMEFNVKKCCMLHFGHRNPKHKYTMNGEILESQSNQRDLGVSITDNCLPGNQCAQAAKKANQILGQIHRSFSCKTKDIMTQVYKVFVRPHLEHAVTSWSPWHRKDVDKLETIQRRATRRMSDVQGSYPERLQQLNLTTLEERRKRGDAIEVFKYLRGFLDVNKETLFTLNNVNQPKTRQQHSFMPLSVPRANLDMRKNFFSVRGAKLWNSLPSYIRESKTVNQFKNRYDALMITN